jgi:AcrR family transcriptional regulator
MSVRQADRSARTRRALLESAARGLSRYGYGNLVLERVASDAGYTRGALYHQFKDKEDLALAVLRWVDQTWQQEVGPLVDREDDPAAALLAMARGHAVVCRRDIARVAMALRMEFSGQDHPLAHHLERVSAGLVKRCTRLVEAGRSPHRGHGGHGHRGRRNGTSRRGADGARRGRSARARPEGHRVARPGPA